jgi:hypothetical protein
MAQANAGAVPAAVAPTTTYFQLFSDAANDSMNGYVQTLLQPYGDIANSTPAQVESIALAARQGQPPVTYCFIVYHQSTGKIHAYINPTTYVASPIRPTLHDNITYIQVGDLIQEQFSLAVWPRTMYHQSNNMLVPSAAQLDNLIAADPNEDLFGPFEAADPNVELIRTRNCCLVPTAYIPLVIDQAHTPKELWATLRGAIVNDGLEQACIPLINFLRACLSRPTANDLSPLALPPANLPTVVALDTDLIDHRRRILVEDFPHFNQAVNQAQANMVSQGIHALTQEVHLSRVEQREERDRDRNKTFESVFPASFAKLLAYAQVANGNLLQPVWNLMARAKKADRLRILSQHLDLAKQQVELMHVKVEVTPTLLEKIINLVFAPPSLAPEFKDYFNCFAIDADSNQALRQSLLYETLYAGAAAPSIADLASISSMEIKAASDVIGYQHVIQKLVIFNQCFWGGTHPVTTSLLQYLRYLNQKQMELQLYQAGCDNRDKVLFYPRLQFKLQTELDHYFELSSIPNVRPTDLPAFTPQLVFQDIRLRRQWEPAMSHQSLEQLGLSLVAPAPPTSAGVPAPPSAPSGEPALNRTIQNTSFNAELFNTYRESSTGARTVRERVAAAGIELPRSRVDASKPMCLAYHTRGRCNTACRHAFDHVAYTAAQYAPLVEFCANHWPQQ